ncbi:MAG TPA: alkaline phosphatase family protein [Acidimicrobiales bacterium]|nr:alkaline phosphatase family protein [Acidimicrobiales bacterium]
MEEPRVRALRRTAVTILLFAASCGGSSPASSATSLPAVTSGGAAAQVCGTVASPPRSYEHVIWIWMENHQNAQVIGNPEAPFETDLAHACGTATHYTEVGSPSLPNYLGATSGSTHRVHDDGSPSSHPIDADNLFRQVRATGGTARTYAEAMPAPCALRSKGQYAVKHNPAAYYVGADDRVACATDDAPLGTPDNGAFASDLANGTLPTFAFVVPDLCDDTHDCGVGVGDRWLSVWIGDILANPAYSDGSTALFVVWDEPTPMPFIAVAPSIRPGTVVTNTVDHYALLRTTEEMLDLDSYVGAATTAPSMRAALGI